MNFPTISYTSTRETRTLSISEAWKWYPFRVEPSRLGHYRECTSPDSPPTPGSPGSPHQAHPLLLYNNILQRCQKKKKKRKSDGISSKDSNVDSQVNLSVCINLHFVYVCFILFAFRLVGYLEIHHFFFLAKAQSALWMVQMRDYLPGLLSIFY